ncbi:SulP family sulfate permease [Propionicimonas paludicola]|uniref:SulP family sulfate permease n=1 Tax=Propionicimonas paludicola TaxID=185243 RepID=A0A2A9CR45_9ACTN|nr:sulfate permease [Propionicimonas paludicola]PFG16082.1 SulP family sulfate permease [Propionicimonas paludicola]
MSRADASGWRRWLPGLGVLLRYDRSWLRGDLLAGITVAAYLIPQVMAYAEIIGLPPQVGLWAVVAPVILYAVLGTSRQLSVGPESTTALLTAAAILALGGTDPSRRAGLAALVAVAVGVVCLIGAVARLGFLASLLSRPVLVGYLAGIGLLMVISQYGNLTGLAIGGANPWSQTASLLGQLGAVHVPTVILGLSVAVVLFVLRRWAPSWPGPLLVMLASAALVGLTPVGSLGLAVVGTLPQTPPGWALPDVTSVGVLPLIQAALGVSVVAYSDVILTGRAFAARREERIDANAELLALGAANLANGFLGGIPVSSSASRTVIGDSAGSRTQLHSLVAAATVVLAIFFLSPVLAAFPQAALAGLVVYAGLRLVDLAELRRIAAFRLSELVLALVTMAAVLVVGLLNGIAIAVALSLLDLIRRIAHPHDGVLGYVPGLAGMHDIDDYPDAAQVPGLVVYRYDSPLFFANADDFLTRALAGVDRAPAPPQWFLLNAEANVEIDLTALDALEQLRATLTERGIVFAMARVKMELRDQLNVGGFLDRVGADRIFPTLPTAVAAFTAWCEAGSSGPPGRAATPAEPQ